MPQPYAEPVAGLIALGEELALRRPWPDYLATFGLDSSHVPELVRMVVDPDLRFADSDSTEAFAPTHAWRALGELRAEEAIEPLLKILDEADDLDDDWALEEIPRALAMIGQPALAPIRERLLDASRSLWTRVAASETLRRMAEQHEAARDAAVDALATQLGRYEQSDPTLNGFIVTALSERKAVDRAPLIERAFSAGAVDIDIMGDWEDVQIELGLLDERVTERPRFGFFGPLPKHAPPAAALAGHRAHAAGAKRKAHRRMEKASRRKNRRRKK